MSKILPGGQRILVVDDNPQVVSLLSQGLSGEGIEVHVTDNGASAIELAHSWKPDLILLDLDLPVIAGDEVCRRLKANPLTQLIPIIIITGMGEMTNRVDAWEYGADEFLTKPFQMVEVIARCRSLLRIHQLIKERDSAEAVVFALARAVETKSPFTHGHSERVMRNAERIAEMIGLPTGEREILRKGALLHDIGKISISDAILNKNGALTDEEMKLVQSHCLAGFYIVQPLISLKDTLPLIRSHHERMDGSGYPDNLKGDQIPLLVRILSLCDIYDSLANDRPYRQAMKHDACLDVLRRSANSGGVDPNLLDLYCQLPIDPSLCNVHGSGNIAPSPYSWHD